MARIPGHSYHFVGLDKRTFTLGNDALRRRLNDALDHSSRSVMDKTTPPRPTS